MQSSGLFSNVLDIFDICLDQILSALYLSFHSFDVPPRT
jgi:hypothetical protein